MATATDDSLKRGGQEEMSFWDHADALRGVILRAAGVVVVLTALFFAVMPRLFDEVIMAPCRSDFWLYGLLGAGDFSVTIVNIKLASQFFIHVSSSFWLALVFSCPVIMYLLWTFVSPALYNHERRGVRTAFLLGNVMFFAGLAAGYFLVFPITLRFLADYQVSAAVPNHISLDSYMDNFLMMIFVMGLVFELPLLCWLLGRLGIVHRGLFNRYRRHAIVVLLVVAAFITPSGDPFTLAVVFLPVYLLWEFGALLVPAAPRPAARAVTPDSTPS